MSERPKLPEIIETERLILRPPRPGDGAEVNAAIRETYEQLRLWMPWADHVPTVEESEEYNCKAHTDYINGDDFGIAGHRKSDGVLVLRGGFHPKDWDVPRFMIGYWCRTQFQGQGYVTEMVCALTRVGFETMKAQRIEITCDARNVASRRVAERCGYRLEAELKNYERAPDGSLRDTLMFALTPETYALIPDKVETVRQSSLEM